MSSLSGNLNQEAWEKLFEQYDILDNINRYGRFEISAASIKEHREPRLMAKYDHTVNLPPLFSNNHLAILPITRGDYVISHFDAYHVFEAHNNPVKRVSLPDTIQSLDSTNVPSEAIALNCAIASGIVSDFLQDESLTATVSGRMGSGAFSFSINHAITKKPMWMDVRNSQIEIDAAYEGVNSLALFEAKRDLSDDFLVRQLYYPFRVWNSRVTKKVRPVFLIYSNGIYHLYEYSFTCVDDYNSLTLVNQKNYSIEETDMELDDILQVLRSTPQMEDPEIPFPQADDFTRVINICELLNEQELSRNDVTEQYAFDARQTNYYTDAARYLGLLDRYHDASGVTYRLTALGKRTLQMGYKKRQLCLCGLILSHRVFSATFLEYMQTGIMPSTEAIVQIMKSASLFNIGSDSTYKRRASTIKGWLNWILSLIHA